MNTCRRKLLIMSILIISIMVVGCKNTNEEKIKPMKFSEIPQEQRSAIKQFFEVDIPEQGNVIYYDFSLKENEYGDVYAEIEFDEKYYADIVDQIESRYDVEILEIEFLAGEKFETTKDKIDKKYIDVGATRRKLDMEKMDEIMYSTYYFIYTTKIENGTFRLMFVGYDC